MSEKTEADRAIELLPCPLCGASIAAWNTRAGNYPEFPDSSSNLTPDTRLAPARTEGPELAELARLSAEATAGEWTYYNGDSAPVLHFCGPDGLGLWNAKRPLEEQRANAAFIVACVNYVRAQLASPSRPDARLREAVEVLAGKLEAEATRHRRVLTNVNEAIAQAYSDAASRLQHLLAQTKEGD